MTDEKWLELVEQVKEKFKVEDEETEPVTVTQSDGSEMEIGIIESIIFRNPMGLMKLSRKTTPLVEGRDEQYHKRTGVAVTKFIYSQTEKVHSIDAYLWNERMENWDKINVKGAFTF
jgi:hypothetical protein